VEAPEPNKLAEFPEQIIVGFANAETVGPGITFIVMVFELLQTPFEPVTVYVVVIVGVTITVAPVSPPGFQV
jgi:hypothetical protein